MVKMYRFILGKKMRRSIILVLWMINGVWTQCHIKDDNEMECSKAVDHLHLPPISKNKIPTVVTILNGRFKSLSKEILKPLESMEYVSFFGNTITNIERGAFSQFPRIKELRFIRNTIDHIDWTEELKNVDILVLEENTVKNGTFFSSMVSRNIRNVKELHLGLNAMKNLDWLRNDFPTLIVLKVPDNLLRTLPSRFGTHMKVLQYLDLQDNRFASINTKMFKGLSNLIDLRLTNNNISEIADSSFADLSKLTSLNLRNNTITSITKDTFKGLHSLNWMTLTENRLDDISRDAFQHIPAIEQLYLHENTITSLEVGTFRNLNNLFVLNIDNNYITQFESGMFENLPNISEIKLRRNDLEELKSGTFSNLPDLLLIDIAWNEIKTIHDSAFSNIVQIQELNLMNNEIREFNPKAFQNVGKIGKINLEGNKIQRIQSRAFYNLNIKYIDFYDNAITSIDSDGLEGLGSLQHLGLSRNNIRELSKVVFEPLQNLTCIDFLDNKVQKSELLEQLPKVPFVFTTYETGTCASPAIDYQDKINKMKN